MKKLIEQLELLKTKYDIFGIKQSFEDEGVIFDDVITMRRITELCNLPLYVKIGGCEAKTDINNCQKIGVDTIIAPMVETPFALKKYLSSVEETSPLKLMFVCETITAYKNFKDILKQDKNHRLSGIVIGRSDFASSMGFTKSQTDSEQIYGYVENILIQAKQNNLITTMGGNVSTRSSEFVKKMFHKKLLDKIETRNVIIKLTENNIDNLDEIISEALNFEINWLKYKAHNYTNISEEYISRAGLLESRK